MRVLLRSIIRVIARTAARIGLKLDIEGWENLPAEGPLIVIGNHFSVFEAPLLLAFLPYGDRLTLLAATEVTDNFLFRYLVDLFNLITVWRGQPDRKALRAAIDHIKDGGVLGIMPEGGVDLDLRERIDAGEQTGFHGGPSSRVSAELIPARPGVAYLAVRSGAPILPVAFLGTEKILHNLSRGRRTPVRMIVGPVFGPYEEDMSLPRAERREQIHDFGEDMMRHMAALMPPENRGPYG